MKPKVDWSLVAPFKVDTVRKQAAMAQEEQYERGVKAGWEARGEKLMRLAMDAIVEETERRGK